MCQDDMGIVLGKLEFVVTRWWRKHSNGDYNE